MSLANGSFAFRQYATIGSASAAPTQELLDKLAAYVFAVDEIESSADYQWGWTGGDHLYDTVFSFEHNVYGDALLFGLRVDTNKVPAEVVRAHTAVEEKGAAAGNPSGFISKAQRMEVRQSVRKWVEDEQRTRKHVKSKVVPVLWDLAAGRVSTPAGGGNLEKLMEIFERTFGAELLPVVADSIAQQAVEVKQYEDLRPTRFIIGPDGDSSYPAYPWVAKSAYPKQWLGNEFALWLWWNADALTSTVNIPAGDITIFIDRTLTIDCAYGMTGKDTIKGDGPSRTPEAREGLRIGKVPRKLGLVLDCAGSQYSLVFDPETFAYGSAKLPGIDDADSPRVLVEERVAQVRDLASVVEAVYGAFLRNRTREDWPALVTRIGRWITTLYRAANREAVEAVA